MKPIWTNDTKCLRGCFCLSSGERQREKEGGDGKQNIVCSSIVCLSSLYHVTAMCVLIRVYGGSFPNFFLWLTLSYFYIGNLLKFNSIVCVYVFRLWFVYKFLPIEASKIVIDYNFLLIQAAKCWHCLVPTVKLLQLEASNQSFRTF